MDVDFSLFVVVVWMLTSRYLLLLFGCGLLVGWICGLLVGWICGLLVGCCVVWVWTSRWLDMWTSRCLDMWTSRWLLCCLDVDFSLFVPCWVSHLVVSPLTGLGSWLHGLRLGGGIIITIIIIIIIIIIKFIYIALVHTSICLL